MGFAAIQKAIENRLNTQWTTTPVQWENVPFTRPANGAWVRCHVLFGDADPGIGTSGSDRQFGNVFVSIFVPVNTYNQTITTYVDSIRSIFNRSTSLSGVTFSAMRVVSKGVDSADSSLYSVTIRFPFWFWP